MNINTGGIIFDESNPTGKATIYVPKVGNTSFDTDYGANLCLSPADIERYEDLFSDTAYCLLSMQLSPDVFYHVARVCSRKNVKLICGVGPVFELNDSPYIGAYILVTTLAGIDILLPGKSSIKDKVKKLLNTHCSNVIITMEYEGQCVLINNEQQIKFSMTDFMFVSHTASIDCFCGALAVALIGGKSLNEAVAYALTGACITMSRKGSLPALPVLEEIIDNIERVVETEFMF
jgi:ribokinase